MPLEDVELRDNAFAWNQRANMLYIDSPAGTGLSYSEDEGDPPRARARAPARPPAPRSAPHAAPGRRRLRHNRRADGRRPACRRPPLLRAAPAPGRQRVLPVGRAPRARARRRCGAARRHRRAQRRRRARAGESYAGVYVPLLAQAVLKGNAAPDALFKVNLKVGRPGARA